VEEIPGVNAQGKTREELMENSNSALEEILNMNRADAVAACEGAYEEVSLSRGNAINDFPSSVEA